MVRRSQAQDVGRERTKVPLTLTAACTEGGGAGSERTLRRSSQDGTETRSGLRGPHSLCFAPQWPASPAPTSAGTLASVCRARQAPTRTGKAS